MTDFQNTAETYEKKYQDVIDKMTMNLFEEASEKVAEITHKTELTFSPYYSEQTGAKVYLKPENMQTTGSFKIRGCYYKISKLTQEQRDKGLIAASAGNHALGVAMAGSYFGCRVLIVMPVNTPLLKVNHTESFGAEVILHGKNYDDCNTYAKELADKHGYTFIHSFDDPDVIVGHGTIAMEIIKELPTVEYVFVPIGGGGLAAGVARLLKLFNPNIKVIGVEPFMAACMKKSFHEGHAATLKSANTIADGAAVKTPGELTFEICREYLDDILTIADEELIVTFLDLMENHKMVAENAGLLTIAALRHMNLKGKKVVSVIGGGNIDVITMSSIVQHGLVERGRIFTVSLLLPDTPGQLVAVATTIADAQGNVVKLEHNQFVSVNRQAAVELKVTIEANGLEHREEIIDKLAEGGFRPKLVAYNGQVGIG